MPLTLLSNGETGEIKRVGGQDEVVWLTCLFPFLVPINTLLTQAEPALG